MESELRFCWKPTRKTEKIKEEWKEGDLCIARYHADNKWYRGQVLKNLGNTLQVEELIIIYLVFANIILTPSFISCDICSGEICRLWQCRGIRPRTSDKEHQI